MKEECSCPAPRLMGRDNSIVLLDKTGKQLAAYSKNCPVHGIQVSHYRVWRTARFTCASVRQLVGVEGARIIDTDADNGGGTVEWCEWHPYTKEDKHGRTAA